MREISLFEIPIYRSNGEDLKRCYRRIVKNRNIIKKVTGIKEDPPAFLDRRYNDVIGWIHISIWMGRIRAEYWFVEQRVVIGLKNKTYDNRGKLFVYKFGENIKESATIYSELGHLLRKSVLENFPKREIDYACFEGVGQFVNWKALLEEYASNHSNREGLAMLAPHLGR